jgi:hypothetical protein
VTAQGTVPTTGYDGTGPFPVDVPEGPAGGQRVQAALTGLIVALPFAGLAVAGPTSAAASTGPPTCGRSR